MCVDAAHAERAAAGGMPGGGHRRRSSLPLNRSAGIAGLAPVLEGRFHVGIWIPQVHHGWLACMLQLGMRQQRAGQACGALCVAIAGLDRPQANEVCYCSMFGGESLAQRSNLNRITQRRSYRMAIDRFYAINFENLRRRV